MQRTLWISVIAVMAALPAMAGPKRMSVQVREGQLRSAPSYLSAIVARVPYGERLTVVEQRAAWTKAAREDGSATGWIHGSALTRKRVTLQAGEADAEVAASSGELALAGKGFNSDVETEFKSRNQDVDFTWVDKMETYTVDVKALQRFVKQGQLSPREGGAK